MASIYKIGEIPGRGRAVHAVSAVSPSQIVIEKEPYAWVLQDDQVASRCDGCARPCERPLRCSRCKLARYCCADHQRAAWGAGHKEECAALAACAPRVPPPTVRMLARALWRRAREQQQAGAAAAKPGGGWADVWALVDHWDDVAPGGKVAYAQMAALARDYMQGGGGGGGGGVQVDVREAALLLARFACNSHTLCDDELRPFGVGLYPLGAMVNHGEPPNAVQSFRGTAIQFRAVRPIAAGEEVTISYVELAAPRLERRQQLAQQYFFDIDAEGPAGPAAAGPASAGASESSSSGAVAGSSGGVGAPAGMEGCSQADVRLWGCAPEWSEELGPDPSCSATCEDAGSRRSGGSGSGSGSGGGSIWLHSFGACKHPPWREDPPDAGMCQVLLLPQTAGGSCGSVGGGKPTPLPGGMLLLPACEQGAEGGAGGLGDASDSFPVGADDGAEGGPGAEAAAAAAAVAASLASSPALAALLGAGAAGAAGCGLAAARAHVLQWGDWGGSGGCSSGRELVVAAAQQLVAVAPLQSDTERLSSSGSHGAAADTLVSALHAAGCLPHGFPAAARAQLEGGGSGGGADGGRARVALGPRHALRQRLLAALLNACVAAGDRWPAALAAAEALTPCYEAAYPQGWPNLGLHHALVAKLRMLLEDPQGAAAAATQAAACLKVTHASSGVLDEVLRIRWEAEQELRQRHGDDD